MSGFSDAKHRFAAALAQLHLASDEFSQQFAALDGVETTQAPGPDHEYVGLTFSLNQAIEALYAAQRVKNHLDAILQAWDENEPTLAEVRWAIEEARRRFVA